MLLPEHQEDTNDALSSSIQWRCGKSTSGVAPNDRKLDNKRCKKWPDHLGTITHAYNSSRSQVTGYSPYFLMMGCRPRLPVDLLFPTSRQLPKTKGVHKYVKALHGHLREALKVAWISSNQEAARHKHLYDQRAGAVELHPGDKSLVHLDSYKGAGQKLIN